MNTKTMTEIVTEMMDELGNPSRSTELTSATAEKQWNKALAEFNKRVGKIELRLLTVNTAEQQYNLIQSFPTINYVYQVKGCYFYLGSSTLAADTAIAISEEVTTGTSSGYVMSASASYASGTEIQTPTVYYATGTLLASATYYATGTLLASATYYATGTLLASATYFPSATLLASAVNYASGTIINPDYYDIDGILLVSATVDTDGTMIQVPAAYLYASGTQLTSATYYASGTLITPAYYDINGGSGTYYASAVYADGSQIETQATWNIDGTLEDQPADYADGVTDIETAAVYADGVTDEETPASYASGTEVQTPAVLYATGTLLASATYFEQPYSYVDYDNENQVPVDSYSNLYDNAALSFINDLNNESNSQLYDRDFQFIEPDTLLLIPAPIASGTLLVLLQTDYNFSTLPDIYEPIVTEFAVAKCHEIIGNARARLNTPQRSGDLVKYASREKWSYQAAERGYKCFEAECNRINVRRMF